MFMSRDGRVFVTGQGSYRHVRFSHPVTGRFDIVRYFADSQMLVSLRMGIELTGGGRWFFIILI